MIKVCMSGATGRMGSMVARHLLKDSDIKVVSAIAADDPNEGKDLGLFLGEKEIDTKISDVEDIDSVLDSTKPDIFIDFTQTEAAVSNSKKVAKHGVNLVIGTTGFSADQKKEIEDEAKANNVTAVIAPNMAVGVNIFFKMAEILTKYLKDYDIEVIEMHHNRKKDAPSGTAKKAAKIISEALSRDLDKVAKYGREGDVGERPKDEIGIHAIRAGDIVGEHTILYSGAGERIEFAHKAQTRDCFAAGTLRAVKFAYENRNKGRIFDMFDVLGL